MILFRNIVVIKMWQILSGWRTWLIMILFKNIIVIKNMTNVRWVNNMADNDSIRKYHFHHKYDKY